MPITSPGNVGPLNSSPPRKTVANHVAASPQSQRSIRSVAGNNDSPWSTTPRGQRSHSQLSLGGSIGKRSGTPAAEYLRWADGPNSPSLMSLGGQFEHVHGGVDEDDDELDFEIHDSMSHEEEGFEGMENVRACCDGRHTVGRSGHDHHHHHHHQNPAHDRVNAASLQPELRSASPAFSFRSRASSTNSREGGGGVGSLFSRFGSRRSTKTVPTGALE